MSGDELIKEIFKVVVFGLLGYIFLKNGLSSLPGAVRRALRWRVPRWERSRYL